MKLNVKNVEAKGRLWARARFCFRSLFPGIALKVILIVILIDSLILQG